MSAEPIANTPTLSLSLSLTHTHTPQAVAHSPLREGVDAIGDEDGCDGDILTQVQ